MQIHGTVEFINELAIISECGLEAPFASIPQG